MHQPLVRLHVALLAMSVAAVTNVASGETCPTETYDLGTYTRPVTTTSATVQQYFDQGLVWAYSFNHEAAVKAFEKATELDPSCAMCFWGIAYALGPNINAPTTANQGLRAYQAVQQARAALDDESEIERAFVNAMASRYSATPVSDRASLDQAFAQAMREVHERFPDDLDAAAIYAEALMNTSPWNYWTSQGGMRAFTASLLMALERVLAVAPDHPAANHYYIHVMEAYYPKRAEEAADRLRDLVPDAGHMVHMPSHIYLRIGRYDDAVMANQKAIAADKRFLVRCPDAGFYGMMYVPHNYDFLVAAASLEGRSALALDAAEEMAALMKPHLHHAQDMVDIQQFLMTPLMVNIRFGQWPAILATPEPGAKLLYARGLWHYARAMAYIRGGQYGRAADEIAELKALAGEPSLSKQLVMGLNSAASVLRIGLDESQGELLAAQGVYPQAIAKLEDAVRRQAALIYIEPPSWYHSTRLTLGTLLLEAGRAVEAGEVFSQDLQAFPENAWALQGLYLSLVKQGRLKEAAAVAERQAKASARADVMIDAARF